MTQTKNLKYTEHIIFRSHFIVYEKILVVKIGFTFSHIVLECNFQYFIYVIINVMRRPEKGNWNKIANIGVWRGQR